jgi:hypothetical protein
MWQQQWPQRKPLGHPKRQHHLLPSFHTHLALKTRYVEQVDERKLVCVGCMEKLICSQRVPGTNKQFLGLVLTAARLLEPAKSVTQANYQHDQHVLFGRRLLADIAFQALYIHCNRIA